MKEIMKYNDILYRVEDNWPIEGVNFIDLTPTLTDAKRLKIVAEALKTNIIENNGDIDFIVSPDARGFLWGSYIAALLEKPIIPIRKSGKLPDSFVMSRTSDTTEYSNIELVLPEVNLENKLCVFIDDVYATGGTYKACKKLINENNAVLEGAYVVYDVLLSQDKVNSLMTSNELNLATVYNPEQEQAKKRVLANNHRLGA